MKTKRLTMLALLTAISMILSYVESFLPSLGVPGIKLGLANIAVIFALYRLGVREAIALSLVRVFLVALLFGRLGALAYSTAGALLSLAVMILLRKLGFFSEVGVSVAGGVAHNAGQILMAMWMLETQSFLYYLPVLAVSGTVSGILIGLSAALLIRRIPDKGLK